MGKIFSDSVEKALQYIYYDNKTRADRGQEGLQLLVNAANAGDGDAACVLARCLLGDSYVWSGHHFPVDEDKAEQLLKQSVLQGSALGILVALRSQVLTPELMDQMPLSLQDAFTQVLEKAAAGDAFCQCTVGNTYFWRDFMTIQGKVPQDFPTLEGFEAHMRENITQCEDWFWKAFRGGMYLAGNNLAHYYSNGDEDFVPAQPEKAKDIFKMGAEMGYAIHQYFYAGELEKAGRIEEALEWYWKAAEGGQPDTWYLLGNKYEKGNGVPKDMQKAISCYERGAEKGETGSCNAMGRICYFGLGRPQDRAKAFEYFHFVYTNKNNSFGAPYLARCYLEGWGTAPNYEQAYNLAWEQKGELESLYVLGKIYCEGLGMPQDIAKGVDFFRRAGDMPEAKEELTHYKRTLFGRWVRR